jgi:hypothetical protein
MRTQNLVQSAVGQGRFDVAAPQGQGFGKFSCQFRDLWATVHADRSQAVYTSQKGAAQSTPHQKRIRGCRALRLPFLHFAWLLSSQVAPRKRKTWFTSINRLSPQSLPSPANTSKTSGRANGANAPRPALFLPANATASAKLLRGLRISLTSVGALFYGARVDTDINWRFLCVPLQSLPSFCCPSSPLAPNRSRFPIRLHPFRLSQRSPANTNNLTGRAGLIWPAFATLHAEVASC